MNTRAGRRPSRRELDAAERRVLAAARRAAAASTRYHYIRTLGGLARWVVMDPGGGDPPPWALRLRAWEGGFYGGGASRQAGLECLRTSGDYHAAYADFEALQALAARDPQEGRAARARHQDQLRKTQRSRGRLAAALQGGPTSARRSR
jgi:hypothetical protein